MPYRLHMMVCAGTGCVSNKSMAVKEAFEREIAERGLRDEVKVIATGCNGFCGLGPIVLVQPDGIFYNKLTEEAVPGLVEEHLIKGRPTKQYMYVPPTEKEPIALMRDIPFFGKQRLIALRNRGLIDPEKIEEYIARDGYAALAKVLTAMTPREVLEEVKASMLRGRGGGGFPTGLKWETAAETPADERFIICNCDEGDPGAFMDRSIVESDPHSVIEGMVIGAYAIDAHQGYIYVRNEYPLALKRFVIALDQARKHGLVGEDILGTGFDFDIEVHRGAGAFICGEETALMASIDGRPGEARAKYVYPAVQGLRGKPTVINNVETWATIPVIIEREAEAFVQIGNRRRLNGRYVGSTGTKVFSLVGKVNNTGLVEVPMGITLREIIFDIGGGIQGGKKFKAVQTGGPSGGCLPASKLDLQVDFDSLVEAGSMMGSGGMIVTDENTCMVDLARYFLEFTSTESCGKCTPCREGTKRMLEMLTEIAAGRGQPGDIERLEQLAQVIKDTSLCGLGMTAPNPVLTTIRYFRDEYEAHIHRKRCPAGVCTGIISAPCHHTCPIGMDAPSYIGYIARGQFEEALKVIAQVTPFLGICGRVCHHPCEGKCTSAEAGDPTAVRELKRFVADWARKKGVTPAVPGFRKRYDEKVAIVGSGPAGLNCAWDLAKMGYRVTVFEALPVAGGMLYAGIPAYRLPRDVLNEEIDLVRKAGVEIRTNTRIGEQVTFDDLRREYQALFICVGAHRGLRLGIPGDDAEGVRDAVDFLREFNLKGKASVGRRVGVIGGGDAAIDAARAALRAGAEQVTIIYRRTRTEMPADEVEIEAALEENIKIHFLAAPTRVITEGGRMVALECVRMRLGEVDQSGRRRPVAQEGTEFTIELDTLLPAISQEPDLFFLPKTDGFDVTKWNTINADRETLATGVPGVFVGGDVMTGPNTVLDAMAHGKRAASSIHKYLRGEDLTPTYEVTKPVARVEPVELTPDEVEKLTGRPVRACAPVIERIATGAEVELGLEEVAAVNEARRCLRCDWRPAPGEA